MVEKVDGALIILEELRLDSKIGKSKHFSASDRQKKYHNLIGIPAICFNIFIGTVLIAFLTSEYNNTILSIVAACLSFLSAVLGAVQTFFNFSKNSEGHRSIGNRYLEVSRNCKMLIMKHEDKPFTSEDLWGEVINLQKVYLLINQEAEAFPTSEKDLKKARSSVEITPFKKGYNLKN